MSTENRWLAFAVIAIAAIIALLFSVRITPARDLEGRYANSPLKGWFDHLASGKGLCCSFADGVSIADVDWETKDGHYRVRIEGEWYAVDDDAVITEPNKAGRTMVWPYMGDGKVVFIRCFMPGEMG